MNILSIDVGMKCLAYCLFTVTDNKEYSINKWGVLDLCREQHHKCCGITNKNKPCDKNARYHNGSEYFCKIHSKKQPLKIPNNELKESYIKKAKLVVLKNLCTKYGIVEGCNKKKILKVTYQEIIFKELADKYLSFVPTVRTADINMVTYGQRMKSGFETLLEGVVLDRVIVENQIGPLALRMKTLQGMIMQHFIEKNCPIIEEISAANKLKDYLTKKKTKYSERKKLGIQVTQGILQEILKLDDWLPIFLDHKKKDDLADSFLQGIWYIKYKLSDN
jgi:hypothetical protein